MIINILFHYKLVVETTTPAYSYDDLFPELPKSSNPKFPASNNNMRIGSSIVTQVIT
jgi:hypothetical protein